MYVAQQPPLAYMHFYVGEDRNTTPIEEAGHTLSQVRPVEIRPVETVTPPGIGATNMQMARLLPLFPGPDGLLHEVGVYHYQQPAHGTFTPQPHTATHTLALTDNIPVQGDEVVRHPRQPHQLAGLCW